jgi:uncharacterized membrane protein HdeD (DUF308 family)
MQAIAKSITDKWWLVLFEGILAIGFGFIAWVWPGLTVATLVLLFGAFAFTDGVLNLIAAPRANWTGESPWGFILQGVLGLGTGILVVLWPDISALALMYVIAFWAIAIGATQIIAAIELRKVIDNEWFLALSGVTSIVFGVLAAIFPGDGAVAVVWAIGLYAIVFGSFLVALSVRLHGWGRQLTSATS